jgi:hypothetical protein
MGLLGFLFYKKVLRFRRMGLLGFLFYKKYSVFAGGGLGLTMTKC